MAFAPASIVLRMLASSLPPVATMGMVALTDRIFFTIISVRAAPETLKISIPALNPYFSAQM